ncbi:MAG: tagaturonate reductase [Acidobacteriota bacterium]
MPTSNAVAVHPLNAELLKANPELSSWANDSLLPERVLQFGEGNFLRGFVDWMVDGMNRKGLFNGRVVVVQPIAQGLVEKLNAQDGAYTLLMRGIEDGAVVEREELIASVSRGINPYTDWAGYLWCARNPELRFIVSNTTEAGIAFNAEDRITDKPPVSFPGKLTLFLLERYLAFGGDATKGCVVLPCELIERNGDALKAAVLATAKRWALEAEFVAWIESANTFTNTLVDRIVTGYPKNEAEELEERLGYRDELLDSSEVFHLWVIEGPAWLAKELPLAEAGFNVIVTDNMKPYRDRKVGILNGAHTGTVLAAYLAGFDYVGDLMKDAQISGFMKRMIQEEVIPTLTLPKAELEQFAEAVYERFSNPFIRHAVLDISLNSISKFKARVLPSLERSVAQRGVLPKRLTFALAALIAFYRGTSVEDGALIGRRGEESYLIRDNVAILETMAGLWRTFDGSEGGSRALTDNVLGQVDWWGKDLREISGLAEETARLVDAIVERGVRAAMTELD